MKIKKISAYPIELELKEPFIISNETVDFGTNIFIKIETDTDIIGWGCSTPDTVTNENENTVLKGLNYIKEIIIGEDPIRINYLNDLIEEKLSENQSLKSGLNMAFYDIIGKKAQMPLYRILGGYKNKIETSVTIGINPIDISIDIRNRALGCTKMVKIFMV